MKKATALSFLYTTLLCTPIFSQQLKVNTFPADHVYLYEVSLKDSLFNLLLHNIGVVNYGSSVVKVEELSVKLYHHGKVKQQYFSDGNDLIKSSEQLFALQQSKQLQAYDFMFRTKDVLGDAVISPAASLQKNEGLILRKQYFETAFIPDSIVIHTSAKSNGKKLTAAKTVKVIAYESANNHYMPVKGTWYAGAAPAPNAHHRWGFMEEFAYDFIMIGDSNRTYKSNYTVLENYYCYGQPVYATEAGEVVAVLDAVPDAAIYPKDLPQEEYMNFIRERQGKLLKAYGIPGLQGNHIIIKHNGNEYSFFAHLKPGSLKVNKGDKVSRGQLIAAVGNSGNSTEPHLHFQINENADAFNSRTVPVRFKNINWSESLEPAGAYIKNGDIVNINKD
ncbi:MAG: M23 family metallopeptidase [Ferruginibacter sp.]